MERKVFKKFLSMLMVFAMMLSLAAPVTAEAPASEAPVEVSETQDNTQNTSEIEQVAAVKIEPPAEEKQETPAAAEPKADDSKEESKEENKEEKPVETEKKDEQPAKENEEKTEEVPTAEQSLEVDYAGHSICFIQSEKQPLSPNAELSFGDIDDEDAAAYLERAAHAAGVKSDAITFVLAAVPLVEDRETAEVNEFNGNADDEDDRITVAVTLFNEDSDRDQLIKDADIENVQVLLIGENMKYDKIVPHVYDEERGVVCFAIRTITPFVLFVADEEAVVEEPSEVSTDELYQEVEDDAYQSETVESPDNVEPVVEVPEDTDVTLPEDVDTDEFIEDYERTVSASGENYSVSMTYSNDANIPDNSTFILSEYNDSGLLYDNLLNSVASTLNTDTENIASATFVDIKIQGEEGIVNIEAPVSVSVEPDAPESGEYKVQVLALGAQNEVLTPDESDAFTTATDDLAQTYAIITVEKNAKLKASDGQTYDIRVSYDRETAGIPETAELVVSELTQGDDGYEEYIAQMAEMAGVAPSELAFTRVFDICLIDRETDVKYQPNENVNVRIQLLQDDWDANVKVDVVHFDDDTKQGEKLDSMRVGDAVEFETSGFSVYGLAGYTVEFHWGDYTYSIAGESSVLLSEVLSTLGVTEVSLIDIAEATFSNNDLIRVEKITAEGEATDWMLYSLAPFRTTETLTLLLKNGKSVGISITDNQDEGTVTATFVLMSHSDATYRSHTWNDLSEAYERSTFNGYSAYSIDIPIGSTLQRPADPTPYVSETVMDLIDATFMYWTTSSDYTAVLSNVLSVPAFDFGEPVTEDVVLYTSWTDDNNLAEVTLTAGSATAEYSGMPLTSNEIEISFEGETDNTFTVNGTCSGSQTEVGSSENVVEGNYAIVANGYDITNFCDVTTVPGTLEVTNNITEIEITTASAEKPYDGTALTAEEYEITDGALLDGDTIDITYTGSQTDSGSSENTATVIIRNSNNEDVTDLYDVALVFGTLTVTGQNITIKAKSAEKVYDGTELTNAEYEITAGSLKEGHTLSSVQIAGAQTNAGASDNVPSNAVILDDATGDNVTSEYFVTYENGTLTVTPVPVTLRANSGTVKYTGSEMNLGYEVVDADAVFDTVSATTVTDYGMYVVSLSGAVVNETRDNTGNYVVAQIENGLVIVEGENSIVEKIITPLGHNRVSYQIMVNPDELTLNDGDPYIIQDNFSNNPDAPAREQWSNQSIDYSSVSATEGTTWDYSGYTGTFTVPDSTLIMIHYITRISGRAGETIPVTNTAKVGKYVNGTFIGAASDTQSADIIADPDIAGSDGDYKIGLFVYADGHMETGLGGATFSLLDGNKQPMYYLAGENQGQPITFTTSDGEDGNKVGYVDIDLDDETDGLHLHKNTIYYLVMETAPFTLEDGRFTYYQKDNTYWQFLITDDPDYGSDSIYAYYIGDALKIRCYPQSGGVNVMKRFAGNYTLTDEQAGNITFTLEKNQFGEWTPIESHKYSEFEYGSITFDVLPSELEDYAVYRVVETNALPEELEDSVVLNESTSIAYQVDGVPVEYSTNMFVVDPDDKGQFSYNFTFTNEYVDYKLTIVKLDELTGLMLPGAVFSVYELENDADAIATYTTGENGMFDLRFDENVYDRDVLYYITETFAPTGYVLPDESEQFYFYFGSEGAGVPEGLPDGVSATNLSNSYNNIGVPNNSVKVNVPVTVTWGIEDSIDWVDNLTAVTIDLYKSVAGGDWEKISDENGEIQPVILTPTHYYDNTSFVNLDAIDEDENNIHYTVKAREILDENGENVIQRYAQSTSVSGTGWYVVNNRGGLSVTIDKNWLTMSGGIISNTENKPAVTVSLYSSLEDRTGDMDHDELVTFLASANLVQDGIELNSENGWTQTIDSLPACNDDSEPLYYYIFEDVPDNQIDTYSVTAATDTANRHLVVNNQQTPSTLEITADNIEKVYWDEDPLFSFTATVTETDETESTVSISSRTDGNFSAVVTKANGTQSEFVFSAARAEGENVGDYEISMEAVSVPQNYRMTFVSGTLTITPAEVLVEAGASKVYGTEDPSSMVTITGLPEGRPETDISFSVFREAGENVGTYEILLNGTAQQGNYIVTFANGEFQITPATLHVKANAITKEYGDEDPELEVTMTGLANGDAPDDIAYNIEREQGENVGQYAITVTGEASQDNYNVTYEGGIFTIAQAEVTISMESTEKVYGEDDPQWSFSMDGLKGADESAELTCVHEAGSYVWQYTLKNGDETILAFDVSREAGESIGNYSLSMENKTEDSNYVVSMEAGSTLSIVRAELYVTAAAIAKPVGVVEDPLLTANISGWANGDDTECTASHTVAEGVVTWTYTRDGNTVLTFTMSREPGDVEGDYAININGAEEQSNYTVSFEPGVFKILSMFPVYVSQATIDPLSANVPTYHYRAVVDLAGSGLSGKYNGNGFVDGVLEFALPTEENQNEITLVIPSYASLTVTQTDDNPAYFTSLKLDGNPYENDKVCELRNISELYYVQYVHELVSLPVSAMAMADTTEADAETITGSNGYIDIPETAHTIDAAFAESYRTANSFTLPTDKYYLYDHASLYNAEGAAIEGMYGITSIKYDQTTHKWQYLIAGTTYNDIPSGSVLVLFYRPEYICQIGTEKFYTLRSAVAYMQENEMDTATIEMLIDTYYMYAHDNLTIPAGLNVTLTTASSVSGTATIKRSSDFRSASMFVNKGTFTLGNIILDGNNVDAGDKSAVYQDAENSAFTLSANATIQNTKGSGGSAIYVAQAKSTANIYGSIINNTSTNVGPIRFSGGTIVFEEGSRITGNSAVYGGAVYGYGDITVNTNVNGNSATNGGGFYVIGGTVNFTKGISGNTAGQFGGLIYQTDGTVTLGGMTSSGSALEYGGAVYKTGGTLNINAAMTANVSKNGAAVFSSGGTTKVNAAVSDNIATASGGAFYMEGGTLEILSNGSFSGNSAVDNGGAIYAVNSVVKAENAPSFTDNSASYGNGGAVYLGGASTLTLNDGTFTTNSAGASGGAIYQASGKSTISRTTFGDAATSVNKANTANNGSAIFVQEGAVTLEDDTIAHNTTTAGGAVAFGSTSTQITFTKNTVVSDNKRTVDGIEVNCNVFLDVDSDTVINTTGLEGSANIGVYVSDGQLAAHGSIGTNFGSTIAADNNDKFKNDRNDALKAWYYTNKLIWSSPITVTMRKVDNVLSSSIYPMWNWRGSSVGAWEVSYYPHSANNPIYDLVTEFTAKYSTQVGDNVYAYSFAKMAGSRDEFLTFIDWDATNSAWMFKHYDTDVTVSSDTTPPGTENSVVMLYSNAAYISITNNSDFPLEIDALNVFGVDAIADNYGYPTVVDYITRETLVPIATSNIVSNGKITVQPNGYIKLLFPGACNKDWSLNGTFKANGDEKVIHYTLDSINTPTTSPDYKKELTTTTDAGGNRSFTLSGKTLSTAGKTYDILFDDPTPICKVNEHPFSTLNAAWDYIKENNLGHGANFDTPATIELLIDYLQPGNDALVITPGYNIQLTTATNDPTVSPYFYHGSDATRATLSRDSDNDGAAVTVNGSADTATNGYSNLIVTNLIFDGKALAKTGNGGAVSALRCDVTIDNCKFMGYRAARGGAIFTSWGSDPSVSKLEITNSDFSNCATSATGRKCGGGAVFTTSRNLTITDCNFDGCCITSSGGNVQGGAVFHNVLNSNESSTIGADNNYSSAALGYVYSIGTSTTLTRVNFRNCYSNNWSGGAFESDAQDILLDTCLFQDAYSQGGNGGAVNAYCHDSDNSHADGAEEVTASSLTIRNTQFKNCHLDSASARQGGGAIRSVATVTALENCTFENCTTVQKGGAIVNANEDATSLTVTGCTFTNCSANNGGAIDCSIPTLSITGSQFTGCTSKYDGGAVRQIRANNAASITVATSSFTNCSTTNSSGGAIRIDNVATVNIGSDAGRNTFTNCDAIGNGGAINQTISGTATVVMKKSDFSYCDSSAHGGAVVFNATNISIDDCSADHCSAVNTGGAMRLVPSADMPISNSTFSNNKVTATTSYGGSIYIGNAKVNTLTNCTISDSIAYYGGGLAKQNNGGTVKLVNTDITGCKAYVSGGGFHSACSLYMQEGSTISGCYAQTSGGGIYNGSMTIDNGLITGCYAGKGGGVHAIAGISDWNHNGQVITNCHARNVTIDGEGNVTVAPEAVEGNNGGGVYKESSNEFRLNKAGAATEISGCSAYDGGGIYMAGNSTVYINYGSVKNNTAVNNGGGVYHKSGTVSIAHNSGNTGSVDGNTAGNYGGGVYSQAGTLGLRNGGSISGNSAVNGGGVYKVGGTFDFINGTMARNTASGNGGAVYAAGGDFKFQGGKIGGTADADANTAVDGAGIFVADGVTIAIYGGSESLVSHNVATGKGGGIAFGGGNAKLNTNNYVTIKDNKMQTVAATDTTPAEYVECNIYLDIDSNAMINQTGSMNASSYIGVYCSDAQDPTHGYAGMPFGSFTNSTNCNKFVNDRRKYFYGTADATNKLLKWNVFAAKVTDGEGNILYKDRNGTPAVYETVENRSNSQFLSGTAFAVLRSASPALYLKNGDPYTGKAFQVQMLVQDYDFGSTKQIKYDQNYDYTITWTTAPPDPDEEGFFYSGDAKHPHATIHRVVNNDWAAFFFGGGSKLSVHLSNIILDGEGNNVKEAGGLIRIMNGASVTLDAGAVIKNGLSTLGSGAIYLGKGNVTMNEGSLIDNCKATNNNGGAIQVVEGTFTMNGGTIQNCEAKVGGGLWIGTANNIKVNINGGTITECTATSQGGGIYTNTKADSTAPQITFSGSPVIIGNTCNGEACNVELAQDSNKIIRSSGLEDGAEIGIYTRGSATNTGTQRYKHGLEEKPFGTWTVAWDDDSKPYYFVNDCDDMLRGSRGSTGDNQVYWALNYLLKIQTEVDSDLTADQSATFHYTLTIDNDAVKNKTFSGVRFNSHNEATLTQAPGQSKTLYLPADLNNAGYNVTVNYTTDQAEDFSSNVKRNSGDQVAATTISGHLGERLTESPPSGRSTVIFTHARAFGTLAISKTVESEIQSEKDTVFKFVISLPNDSITKVYPAKDADGNDIEGGIEFKAGHAEFELQDGQSIVIFNLPTDLVYDVEEDLSSLGTVAARIRTKVDKDGTVSSNKREMHGTLGEHFTTDAQTGKKVFRSDIEFINSFLEIICKITRTRGSTRELLYYLEDNNTQIPAVYNNLAEAFARVNRGGLKTASGESVSGLMRIELVVPEYAASIQCVLDSGRQALLTTALTTDTDGFPYTGTSGTAAVVTRGNSTSSMILDNGTLTIDKIVLDGGAEYDEDGENIGKSCEENGGLIRVNNAVKLTLNSTSILRNSETSENGGAIWMSIGSSLVANGSIDNCSAANGGGVYADTGFKTISIAGTITNSNATDGSGGAIYASTSTSTGTTIANGASLTGNSASANGGAIAAQSNVIIRGNVGGVNEDEGNYAGNNGGGVYTDSGANFYIYSTGVLAGNEAGVSGGGLFAGDNATISGAIITQNSATNGGGIYVGDGATANISNSSGILATISENSAQVGGGIYDNGTVSFRGGNMTNNTATQSGGAVYVGDSKTFTETNGTVSGNKSPRGAIATGRSSVLTFSGNTVVNENTDMSGETPMNVYLGYDSNSIIRSSGLGSSARIGIYAADGTDTETENDIYQTHGIAVRNFGTYTGTSSNAHLYNFINDRDNLLVGDKGAKIDGSDYSYLMWPGKNVRVMVYGVTYDAENAINQKTPATGVSFSLTNIHDPENADDDVVVWTGKSNNRGAIIIEWSPNAEVEKGNYANFAGGSTYVLKETSANESTVLPGGSWNLVLDDRNGVSWTTTASNQGDNRTPAIVAAEHPDVTYFSDMELHLDVLPVLTFNANGGKLTGSSNKAVTIDPNAVTYEESIPFTKTELNHSYTIAMLNPIQASAKFLAWGTAPERPEDFDGEKSITNPEYKEYQKGDKITWYRGANAQDPNHDDMTLYAIWEIVVCKLTDRNGKLLYLNGAPAVYGTLEEGFDAYNNSGITDFTYADGSTAYDVIGGIEIQMLHDHYTLPEGLTLARGKIATLTTAYYYEEGDRHYDGFSGPYIPGNSSTVCKITRDDDFIYGSMFTTNANLTISNITLDGGAIYNGNDNNGVAATASGGIIHVARQSAMVNIISGATLVNSDVDGLGGAIYAEAGSTVYMHGGSVINNGAHMGGAVYMPNGSTINLDGGTIADNTAAAGAGIYLAQGSTMHISGAPSFGSVGNFATTDLPADSTNGTEQYSIPRQDIYLVESGTEDEHDPATIIVTGDILSASASIWVWAESPYHYKQLMPFAKCANGVSFVDNPTKAGEYSAVHLIAFRNARTDSLTENSTETYLCGTNVGDVPGFVYWSGEQGTRKVLIRKVDSEYGSASGKEFAIFRGASTTPYKPRGATDRLEHLSSKTSGGIWVGVLPLGTYIIEETSPNRYYYLLIHPTGVYCTLDGQGTAVVEGYASRTDAVAAAAAMKDKLPKN